MAIVTEKQRRDVVEGLRALADYLARTDTACPRLVTINAYVDTREELAAVVSQGSWEKQYVGDWFVLRRAFGPEVALEVNAARERVCRKVSKGTHVVPAKPEQVVEDFEWVCDGEPLLAGAGEEAQ